MAEPSHDEILAALRTAARLSNERYLVGVTSGVERARIVSALSAEGEVVELASAQLALERLAEESFELVVLDQASPNQDVLAEARRIRPFADIVPIVEGDAELAADMFIGEAAALLPRPLPVSDALFRAHLRYLASCRRARTRALMLTNVIARNRAALRTLEPALEDALAAVIEAGQRPPVISVLGDGELVKAAAGNSSHGQVDVVVVGLSPSDRVELRLREVRDRAAGAAVVTVDASPSRDRMTATIYGGVRAYLGRKHLPHLARVAAITAGRRRAEMTGRQLAETLTRFGFMAETTRTVTAPTGDLDARLIAQASTNGTGPVVPSAHEVLVVDDEVVVLTVLREILRRSGYRVTTAASAEEAIEMMQKRTFDLVLTDKNLPGASGLEVLRVARGLNPPPAVVMITGYSSYDSAVTALDIGAQDYIEKPIRDVDALRFRIRRALSRRNEQLERKQEPAKGDLKQFKILVVEIEGDRRALIAEYLGQTYSVTTAANGDDALELLQKARFDLVIADRNLPGMSGLRVIEQAQRLLPHCASVLYTAYPSYETVKEAFELGVDAYLVRPNQDLKSLAEKVAGALRSRGGGILLG
jgi:CheY-like chemotaxis protein